MKRKPQIIIGIILIVIFVLLAVAAPLLAPNDPNATDLALKNALPSAEYPLGCDQMGRCELSRLIYGARYSLGLSIPVLIILASLSLFIGCYSSYKSGIVDEIMRLICDIFMAYSLMWECVGGSVVKGEDSLQGAIREAKEEVGVDLMPENGQVLFTKTRKIIEGKIFNDIMDVWLFEYDGEVDLGNATTDEVAQVAWMNREQIKELFDANMFVDTLEYFFTEVDK